jgi:hypothetical protein
MPPTAAAPELAIAAPCADTLFTVSNDCDLSNCQSTLPSSADTASSIPFVEPSKTTLLPRRTNFRDDARLR